MEDLSAIAISAALINNVLLTRFLGLCPFFGVTARLRPSAMMGFAVIFVMVCASAITWSVYHHFLVPLRIDYMRIVVFILVIASFVQLVEMLMRKFLPEIYQALGIYLPLITTNCAILGATLINVEVEMYSFLASLVHSFAMGFGFLLSMILMAGIRMRLELYEQPDSFRGYPILFIVAAMLGLAFQGFSGMVR